MEEDYLKVSRLFDIIQGLARASRQGGKRLLWGDVAVEELRD
jgi:hypothetical protein